MNDTILNVGDAGTTPAAASPAPSPASSPAPSPSPTPTPTPAAGDATPKPSDAGTTPAAAAAAPSPTPTPAGDADVKPDWPTDWRNKMAGEDKKLLAQLERFTSPVDLAKKIREQDALIAQGKHKQALPADATAEQIAAFRKDNGIPETADKYDLTLPSGIVIGEQDKPIVNTMLGVMHDANLSNDTVKKVLDAYYAQESAFLQQRDDQIADSRKVNDDALRKEWGDEYRTNVNVIGALSGTFSKETRNALGGALDSNGMPLLNNKDFLKDMAIIARTINPIDTLVSGNGGSQMSSVETEISQIEKRMETDRDGYFKDEKQQKRYRDLLEWRENNKPKK